MESSAAKPMKKNLSELESGTEVVRKDPLEAIFALNIGDFLTEGFISDELLQRISERLGDDPEKLKRQLSELIQIYSLEKTLGILGFRADEGQVIYDSIASTLCDMLQMDACHIFQSARKKTGEEYLSLTGTSIALETGSYWNYGFAIRQEDLLSQIFQKGKPKLCEDLEKTSYWHPIPGLNQERTKSLIACPLVEGKKPLGLLLFEFYTHQPIPDEFKTFSHAAGTLFITSLRLQQIIGRAEYALKHSKSSLIELRSLRANITESIADLGIFQQEFMEALALAIDARQHFTQGHSRRIANIAKLIAESLQLNEKTVDLIYYAGLMGNIGKIHIPKAILSKTSQLTAAEWDALRNHPNIGISLLAQINILSEIIPFVYYQKELWNGSGCPERLSGMSIPLGSRILAVADAYYAMNEERPYRVKKLSIKKFSHEEAIRQLQKEAGIKWDPLIVQTLAAIPKDSLL